jgi:8-oxo-dGTP diphosphatase
VKRVKPEGELKDDLSNYDENSYKKPSVTVDICICTIVDKSLKILLIKRKFPPFRDCWAIPGGFLDLNLNETLEEAAARELREETSLENIYVEQLKTYGDPGRDPRTGVVTVAYFALVPWTDSLKTGVEARDDAKEYQWFDLRWLPHDLAFDHAKILSDLLNRLIGKLAYSPIAFSLLPKKFTWTELQSIYEVILGRKLIAPNFRRKIKSLYNIKESLNFQRANRPGRPPTYLVLGKKKEAY